MTEDFMQFGQGNSSYKAAGELSGLTQLVDDFYDNMDRLTVSSKIRDMHPEDLTQSRQKLVYFLSGWLGGPRLYAEHFGSISIPFAHKHLSIGVAEKEAWLCCMQIAVEQQPYDKRFKLYLMQQLEIPADRIRVVSND